jgi:ribosome-binding factor A
MSGRRYAAIQRQSEVYVGASRAERVSAMVHAELVGILRDDCSDPRVERASVVHVRMSPDLRHAYVDFAPMGGDGDGDAILKGLQSAKGFLKRQIARRLGLRFTPDLHFRLDDQLETASRVSRLIGEVSPPAEGEDEG